MAKKRFDFGSKVINKLYFSFVVVAFLECRIPLIRKRPWLSFENSLKFKKWYSNFGRYHEEMKSII